MLSTMVFAVAVAKSSNRNALPWSGWDTLDLLQQHRVPGTVCSGGFFP